MYICKSCGWTFEEPYEYEERHGFEYGPFEKWSVCPNCGEPDYEIAVRCNNCDKFIAESDVYNTPDNKEVCKKCFTKMMGEDTDGTETYTEERNYPERE